MRCRLRRPHPIRFDTQGEGDHTCGQWQTRPACCIPRPPGGPSAIAAYRRCVPPGGPAAGFSTCAGLVADGRDMGTVIFPDARFKVFLTASAEERARRRYKQLKDKGVSANLASLLHEIAARDERDAGRAVAPLKPAADAVILDSTGMPITELSNGCSLSAAARRHVSGLFRTRASAAAVSDEEPRQGIRRGFSTRVAQRRLLTRWVRPPGRIQPRTN